MTKPESKKPVPSDLNTAVRVPEKKSRVRSPNFPVCNLEKAVELIDTLNQAYKTSPVPVAVAHEKMGYKPHGGVGDQVVAAIRSYGLIEVEGTGEARKLRVSDAGRRIVLNHPDRPRLLKEAALKPPMFAEIWQRFGADGIPAKELIRHYALLDRPVRFNDDSVDAFIDRFLESLAFAKITADDKIVPADGDDSGREERDQNKKDPPPPHDRHQRRPKMPGTKEATLPLDAGEVVITWPNDISPEEIEDLKGWMELMVRKIERTSQMRQATRRMIDDHIPEDDD